jgi:hypothetical protein
VTRFVLKALAVIDDFQVINIQHHNREFRPARVLTDCSILKNMTSASHAGSLQP